MTALLGIGIVMAWVGAVFTIIFVIGQTIRRADREQERPQYLSDDPRIVALFSPSHPRIDSDVREYDHDA